MLMMLMKFTQGYCGPEPLNTTRERGRPNATNGWGYCDKQCDLSNRGLYGSQNMLQEAKLEILPQKECKKMGSSMKVKTNIELCAAKQVPQVDFPLLT
jgi:hypothetical protein